MNADRTQGSMEGSKTRLRQTGTEIMGLSIDAERRDVPDITHVPAETDEHWSLGAVYRETDQGLSQGIDMYIRQTK